jgi:formamidopyrimidine-DNA glycosylase
MPELPEIETIRRQLGPHMEGRVLESVEVLDPRWCEPAHPGELADAVRGRRIDSVHRRGKYFAVALEDDVHLVMHLRMTGNLLLVAEADDEPGRAHLRARLSLDDGNRVLFTDQRRFGTGIVLLGTPALNDYFDARLGVEPLGPDFTSEALREIAAGRRAPVKAFLLTQERIAGVGNIYADEALFRARIHPLRPVGTLKRPQLAALRDAVVASLEAGIDARGATIDDFRNADGASGSFQDRFLVHRRAAGRGTSICPRCQRPPRV